MQVCTSLQTNNHASTQFFTGRMPFLPPNQQHQSTEGKLKSAQLTIKDQAGAKLQATNHVPRPVDRGTATRYGG